MTYDGRMDDNTTATLMLATLEAMIVGVVWLICRSHVKAKRIERETPQSPEPEPWPDGHRWRDDVPAQTPLDRDVTKPRTYDEGEN